MIRSMTAFGRGESARSDMQLVVEMRSLNNRYRDIIVKLPRSLQFLEEDIRNTLAGVVQRGRVEVAVQSIANGEERPGRLELNEPVVKAYLAVFDRLSEEFGMPRDIRMDRFCLLNDVIVRKPEELDETGIRTCASEAMEQAVAAFEAMRTREGVAIEADFNTRLDLLSQYAEQVAESAPQVAELYRRRLKEHIGKILGETELDEGRLAQEVALFAERADITEELVRLRSHLEQFKIYLGSVEAVGRRLDFLLQEMHREINTLSAKASDSGISRLVVEMKSELEKIREQVQNVE